MGKLHLVWMSIISRAFHGPELKCGGPQMCPDCQDRVRQGEEYGMDPWSIPHSWREDSSIRDSLDKLLKNIKNPPKSE